MTRTASLAPARMIAPRILRLGDLSTSLHVTGGRGEIKPFSHREKGWDEGAVFISYGLSVFQVRRRSTRPIVSVVFGQVVDQRAADGATAGFALAHKAGQRLFDIFQVAQSGAHDCELVRGDIARLRAVRTVIEFHEIGDLLERKAKRLRGLDELKPG